MCYISFMIETQKDMTTKITKKAIRNYLRTQLGTSEVWAKAALLKIMENQTEDEQVSEHTIEYNGIGFTGCDGHILTSFANQYKTKGWLSPKQVAILLKKMSKYWKQILSISDYDKLEAMTAKSLQTA